MYACSTYWYVVAHNPLQLTPYAQQDQSTRVTTVDALGRCPGAGHPVTDVRRSRTGGPTACAGGGRTRATPFGCTQRRTFYLRTVRGPRFAVQSGPRPGARPEPRIRTGPSAVNSWVVPRLVPGWLAIVHFGSVGRLWGLFERALKSPRGAYWTQPIYTTQPDNTGSTDTHRTAPPRPSAQLQPSPVGRVAPRSIPLF